MESFKAKREIPESFSPEEVIKLHEMEDIMDSFRKVASKRIDFKEIMGEITEKALRFRDELEEKGLNPLDYVLWHRIAGSGNISVTTLLDTPDHDLEKFIKATYTFNY